MEQENKNENIKKEEPVVPVREIHHHYRKSGNFFGRLTWGLVIIFLGLVILAQNAGMVPQGEIWNFLVTFWPIFIIFAGLSVLARGGWVLGIISTLLMLAVLALCAMWFLGIQGVDPRLIIC